MDLVILKRNVTEMILDDVFAYTFCWLQIILRLKLGLKIQPGIELWYEHSVIAIHSRLRLSNLYQDFCPNYLELANILLLVSCDILLKHFVKTKSQPSPTIWLRQNEDILQSLQSAPRHPHMWTLSEMLRWYLRLWLSVPLWQCLSELYSTLLLRRSENNRG